MSTISEQKACFKCENSIVFFGKWTCFFKDEKDNWDGDNVEIFISFESEYGSFAMRIFCLYTVLLQVGSTVRWHFDEI